MIEFQHIRVPLIYELKRTDKKTIVKMQYVYSKNFIEFFEQAGFEQIDYLVGALKYFIEYEINKCKLQVVSPQIFRAKFDDIRMKLEKNAFFNKMPKWFVLLKIVNLILVTFKRCCSPLVYVMAI